MERATIAAKVQERHWPSGEPLPDAPCHRTAVPRLGTDEETLLKHVRRHGPLSCREAIDVTSPHARARCCIAGVGGRHGQRRPQGRDERASGGTWGGCC